MTPRAAAPVIGIVDFGAGNLGSVESAVTRAGAPWKRVARPADLTDVDRLILPGVGRFAAASARLREAGLDAGIVEFARSGRPLLGICLGMQLLCSGSDEDPGIPGLGIFPERVERLRAERLPHIGWTTLAPAARDAGSIFAGLPERFDAYFAHSYAVTSAPSSIVAARAASPTPFAAAMATGATWGVQFHPEKSAAHGQAIIANFVHSGAQSVVADLHTWPTSLKRRDLKDSVSLRQPPSSKLSVRSDLDRPHHTLRTTLHRIIPCLDVQSGRVVKGVRFRDLRDAGDPVERAEAYDRDGADEICLLDISASVEERRPLLGLVERVARRLTVPLSVGGGVRDVEEMRLLLLAGADRVAIGTAACRDPDLVSRAAAMFGSQCVIVSIDALRREGGWEVTTHGGRRPAGREAIAWAREVEALGAGEVLLNAMDADGTRGGYDIELTRRVARAVNVPVIASGGAGAPSDMTRVFLEGEADAALAASIFHDGSVGIRQVKEFLREAGVRVRL